MKKKKESLGSTETFTDRSEQIEDWAERNPKILIGLLVVILLIAGGYFGFRYYIATQNDIAQKEFFQAIRHFESDSLLLALDGDGNSLGMNQLIDEYEFTEVENLSHFYVGMMHLKSGDFESSIVSLKEFNSDDVLIQARAYSLMGDAYMELEDYENATIYYNEAASYEPNEFFTPGYLMKEALAYEKSNQPNRAKIAYQKIIDHYWESTEYSDAKKFQARLGLK